MVDNLPNRAIDLHEVPTARILDLYNVPFLGHYCMPMIDCTMVEAASELCLLDRFSPGVTVI